MAQLTYAQYHSDGYAGDPADAGFKDDHAYVQAEASAEMPFGVGVVQGAADSKAVLPSGGSTAANFRGVLLRSDTYDSTYQLGTTGVKPQQAISVRARGRVKVTVEEAVSKGDRAFLRITANGGDLPGQWRKSADGGKAIELKGCYFATSADAGALAILDVDVNATKAAV